jgi:hypothetical protein
VPSTPTMAKIESPKAISINVLRDSPRSASCCASSEGKVSRGVRESRLNAANTSITAKLEHQELPVPSHNQSAERADQDPGVDEPRQDQCRDTGNAKR